jgi:hypothetical protein
MKTETQSVELALSHGGLAVLLSWSFFRYSSKNEENPCTPSSENQILIPVYVHCAVNDYYYWTYKNDAGRFVLEKYYHIIALKVLEVLEQKLMSNVWRIALMFKRCLFVTTKE